MRHFQCVLLDVFTNRLMQGNQLAVFTDARGLSDDEMQSLAGETNLSETAFIIPREAEMERERGVKVRIFTVSEELPFAGHPTLGTAAVVRGTSGAAQVALDLKVGKIPVTFEDRAGDRPFGEMRQRDPEFGVLHDRVKVAYILGISADEISADVPIQTVSTGMAFAIVPIQRLSTMQNLTFNAQAAEQYAQSSDVKFFYFVCRETVDARARLHARMFFYNGEDPATGSAAGCAAAWMVKYGVAAPEERVMIEQGIERKRPSEIFVVASNAVDKIVNVRVGGQSIEIARSEFMLA